MLQQLFGAELDFSVRLAISVIVIAALLGVTVLVMRRLGGGLPGRAAGRGRQGPRLAIIDALSIDQRRRLVLVRRDDVEHLLLTGGTNDVVVEQNITGGYVATGGVRPALPLEREAPPAVAAPAAKAPLANPAARPPLSAPPQRQEAAPLPPAAPQPEALAAAVAAAALSAPAPTPAAEPRLPPRAMPDLQRPSVSPEAVERAAARLREGGFRREAEVAERPAAPEPAAQRPLLREPRPSIPPAAEPEAVAEAVEPPVAPKAIERRAPAEAPPPREPEPPQADAATDEPDEGRQPEAGSADTAQKRLEAILAHVERRKSNAAALRRRLASLPDDQKAATVETIKRIDLQIARLLKEAERITATDVQPEPATEQPQPSDEAAKRGLALLLGAERPATKPREADAAVAAPPLAATVADRIAARKAAAEKAVAERAAAENAEAERAAAETAAAEKAAAERVAAEKVAAEKAAAEKAAAERAAAEKAAAEKAAAEKAAAEKVAAEMAAAEKAAAERAAAEKARSDQIAAEMAAALKAHEPPPTERRMAPPPPARTAPAVEPRLKEMAQRLDAALARPADDKLRLSLSDLLEDIEGAAADVPPPASAQSERPRIPVAPREPIAPRPEPRPEPRPRANLAATDYSRFLSDEPTSPPRERASGTGESPARPAAKELFSDGWIRSTRRLDREEEPSLKAPEVTSRSSRLGEPAAPRPREPFLSARRSEPAAPAPLLNALPKIDPTPAGAKPANAPEIEKPIDKTAEFLDEFDAEMATLLGRTPSR